MKRYSPEEVFRIATPTEQAQLRLGNMALGGKGKGRKSPSPLNILFFSRLCEQGGVPRPVGEYLFHPTRKWRFDVAWVAEKVALEVHGGGWTNGGHNRSKGAMNDWEKVNEAQLLGWIVLQVPRSVVTFDDWMNLTTVKLARDAISIQAGRSALAGKGERPTAYKVTLGQFKNFIELSEGQEALPEKLRAEGYEVTPLFAGKGDTPR